MVGDHRIPLQSTSHYFEGPVLDIMLSITLNIMKFFYSKKNIVSQFTNIQILWKKILDLFILVKTTNRQGVTSIILNVTYLAICVRDLFKTTVEDHRIRL